MTKLYNNHINHITQLLVDAAKSLHNAGNLTEAANIIRKAGDFFLPEFKAKSKNKSFQKLKLEYDKTQSIITTSMIKAMEETKLKNK